MGLAQLFRFRRTYKQGDVIATQGKQAEEFFILEEGTIGIYRYDVKVAEVNEPGAYVGEMAMLLNQARNATMKCETQVICYALPAQGLEKMMESTPDISLKLIHSLAERLDQTTRQLDSQEQAPPVEPPQAA